MTVSPQTTAPPGAAAARPRLLYIDNLRILLTGMVVIHHAAVTYGHIPVWYYTEPATEPSGYLLDVLVMFNQMFFMGFFFMISGYFVPAAFDRKGGKAFIRGRLFRLGVPLLLFTALIRPVLGLSTYLSDWADKLPYPIFFLVSWDPGPMWFVELLLVFCLGYLIVRHRAEPKPSIAPDPQSGTPLRPLPVIGFVLALALVTWVWRFVVTVEVYVPVLGLPSAAYLPQYLSLFMVGVLAYRRGWFQRISAKATWWGLAAAVLGFGAAGAMLSVSADRFSWQALASAIAECTFAIGIITFATGLFQRRFNRQRAFGKYLSGNAFGVYFLHPLVLVALGYALSGWHAPAIYKWAGMVALGVPLCWLLAGLVRRVGVVRKVL